MAIATRGARREEYPLIRSILSAAFKDDEVDLWDYLVAHDASLTFDRVRVALNPSGEVVACTVVLPRTIRGPQGPVAGAVITLVACHPDVQNQGYGGAAVRDAVAYMQEQGWALGVLYGHPGYYPRFGFAPVLPPTRTHLPVPQEGPEESGLVPVAEADLDLLASLFRRHMGQYPCAVERGPEPWLWRRRRADVGAVLRLNGEPGYAFLREIREQEILFVPEAAADGVEATRHLLAGLVVEARRRGLKEVRLATPSRHPLSRLAQLHGAEQRVHKASAGMAVVTDWAPLLPPGFGVNAGGLQHRGRLLLTAEKLPLTQLVLGYRTVSDLVLSGEGLVTPDPAERALLDQAFPYREPRWSLAPFWE